MRAAAADIAFIVGEASMELLFDDGEEDAADADAAMAAAVADAGMVVGAAGAVVSSCSSFVMVQVNELFSAIIGLGKY